MDRDRQIIEYYTKEGMSLKQIADKLNISSATAGRVLRINNIQRRKPGGSPTYDPQLAIQLYQSGLTLLQVADRLGVNRNSVFEQLKKHNIDTSRDSVSHDELVAFYRECKSVTETTEKFKLAREYVLQILCKHGIKQKADVTHIKDYIKETLQKDPNTTLKQLRNQFKDLDYSTLVRWFKLYGGNHTGPEIRKNIIRKMEDNIGLIQQLAEQGVSYREISRKVGVLTSSLIPFMKKNNIVRNNYNYKVPYEAFLILNDPIQMQQLVDTHKSAQAINDIQFKGKVSSDTIRFYLKKHNIPYNLLLKDLIPTLNNKEELVELYKTHSLEQISYKLNVSLPTVSTAFKNFGIELSHEYSRSKLEIKLVHEIEQFYKGTILTNQWNIIPNRELDIVLPELKVAIEVCGVYWHSEKFKPNNYHVEKMLLTEQAGYRLLTIFEDELMFKNDIVLRKIQSVCGCIEDSVYARKTKIVEVGCDEARDFLTKYHIQGYVGASFYYGLRYKDDLVAIMTFKKFEGYHELSRYASVCNVVGGFSKLLEHFKKSVEWEKITTFADLRWSKRDDNVYVINNFTEVHLTKPAYFYVDYISKKLIHRMHFQKKHLDKLMKYDSLLTERQNANNNGYYAIYNCGNVKYEINNRY